MVPFIPNRTLVVLAALACGSVTVPAPAQPASFASLPRPDPTDVRSPIPPVQHRSALAGYRRQADVPAIPWRDANDTVTRIGGWRSYAREASAPEGSASAPAMQHKH